MISPLVCIPGMMSYVPMLRLQRQIVTSVRSGFRPLQPVARGLDDPLPDFPVSLPSPSSVPDHFLLSPDCLPEASPLPAQAVPPPAAGPSPTMVEEDLCSLSSESTDSDSADEDVAETLLTPLPVLPLLCPRHTFLWNARSNVVHVAVATFSDPPVPGLFSPTLGRNSGCGPFAVFSAVPETSVTLSSACG